MTVLVFETHSLSTDNDAGLATGWLPGALSSRGRALAAELGARRHGDHLAAVYVSDLARAVQTAEIAFAGVPIPITRDQRLREIDYGDLTGVPVEVVAQQRRRRIDTPYPGGQSYRDVVHATAGFLADMRRDHAGQRVLVISHSANKWALDHLIHGVRLEDLVDADFGWREGWEYLL